MSRDKAKKEAVALGKFIQAKPEYAGPEEWERLQYLRTLILINKLKNEQVS